VSEITHTLAVRFLGKLGMTYRELCHPELAEGSHASEKSVSK
jgi:hypothetical protein